VIHTFYAHRPPWSGSIEIGIGQRNYERNLIGRGVLTFHPHEDDAYAEATMRLTRDEARELMDCLWAAGVRPTNGEGNAGQLGATERHLEDMRKLVFKAGC
jgi:hypothetical protein